MKWILLILLISCSDNTEEDMKQFIINLPSEAYSDKTHYNIVMSGQSIAQGQYPISQSGYSSEKINNPSAEWLDCTIMPNTWKLFDSGPFSPYPTVGGCSMEYTLAEYFKNDGKTIKLYKPAEGAQLFGTDADPGKFHVNSDLTPNGEISIDIKNTMTEQKTLNIEFDYMLWMHGESDGKYLLSTRNAYEMNMRRFIDMVRLIQPDIPFLMRRLPPETEQWMGDVIPGGREAINTAFDNIAADTPNCYIVIMPEPFSQGDEIHPSNPTGNDQMADAYWEVLQTLIP